MTALDRKLRTFAALGVGNIARVAVYRTTLRAGVHRVQRIVGQAPAGPFFTRSATPPPEGAIARRDWSDTGLWFGAHAFPAAAPPDWHMNPFTGARIDAAGPWFAIPDFDPAVGDIKTVWEASRFDWLIAMAQRAAFGNEDELQRLNRWLDDWAQNNPPYLGANWKCGQEASIRVLHLALAALLLDQVCKPLPALLALVELHLARIAPTVSYAIAQQNNHATSEAAALLVGGSWLALHGRAEGHSWEEQGRSLLAERVLALVMKDGSFSQHSLVYHRMMLDTCSFADSWCRSLGLRPIAPQARHRLAAATAWLQQMIEPETGDGPNYGANDGARILALTDSDYRDFRPSLQWAAAVFRDERAIAENGAWDQPLHWLGLAKPSAAMPAPASVTLDDGGLHVLRRSGMVAYLRYPRFRFRPGQADALHLDFWLGSDNLLRDGGTYSYNASAEEHAYFSGCASHNTAQFDGREQMPRLGRFLFGDWLQARSVVAATAREDAVEAAAAYRDSGGATHDRHVTLEDNALICIDQLAGAKTAVLRWRLRPGDWRLDGTTVSDGTAALTIASDDPAMRLSVEAGWESRYYLRKTPLPVVEIAVALPAVVTTRLAF